MHDGDRI